MSNSIFFFCPAEHRAAINAVLNLLGYGPDSFSVGASADGQQPFTIFYGNYEDMPLDDEEMWRSLRDGLPELEPGAAWGEDGLPSEEDARAAVASFELLIREGPNMTASQHTEGILHSLGVQPFSLD